MSKMKNPNPKINAFVVVCSHRDLNIHSFSSFSGMTSRVPSDFNIVMSVGLEASIAKSRSYWATVFHKEMTNFDVMCFVDDDMVFDPKDLWKIMREAHTRKCIYGAVYMKRELPPKAIVSLKPGESFSFDGSVREVQGLGTGFMAFHREVLDKIVPNCELVTCGKVYKNKTTGVEEDFPVYYPMFAEIVDENKAWLSEDYGFCKMARESGSKIICDTSLLIKHAGSYLYSALDLNIFKPVQPL
jgi:choline kinase